MRGVSGFNVEEDVRHTRRSLTDDELGRLIHAAEHGPKVFEMSSPLRAIAYRMAMRDGFLDLGAEELDLGEFHPGRQ